MNDEFLKNGQAFGQDYFEELLERIREIRRTLVLIHTLYVKNIEAVSLLVREQCDEER